MSRVLLAVALAILLSIVGVLGTVWDLSEKIVAKFPFLEDFVWMIELAFVVVLLCLCFGSLAYLAVTAFRLLVSGVGASKRYQDFVVESVFADDLPAILKLYQNTANGTMSLEASNALYAHCKKGFRKIRDLQKRRIVGYFVVLALTEKGVRSIESRSFDVATGTPPELFRKRIVSNSAAYIGAVVVESGNFSAKGFAVQQLIDFIKVHRFSRAFARPTTKQGLSLVKNWEFAPVFSDDKNELGVIFTKSL